MLTASLIFTGCKNNTQHNVGNAALLAILDETAQNNATEQNIDTKRNTYTIEPSPISLDVDVDATFVQNITYGPDVRNTYDFFKPTSATPTSLVIYIHGGGFRGGSKEKLYESNGNQNTINQLLSNNIAVATINYRLLEDGDTDGVLKCLNDSKRALQFMRRHASQMNIDKEKIVLWGGSAGAGTSLWLALQDDMADPDNADLVLRESTRVLGVSVSSPQTTYDFDKWVSHVFIDFNMSLEDIFAIDTSLEAQLLGFYGISSMSEYDTPAVNEYRAAVDMLSMVSSDDPELHMVSASNPLTAPTDKGALLHHPHFVREMVEAYDAIGLPTVYEYGYGNTIYRSTVQESTADFLMRKLAE